MLLPLDIHFISTVSNGIDLSEAGLDIGLPYGTPLVACADGRILYSGPDESLDAGRNRVLIKLNSPLVVCGIKYVYAWYGNLSRVTYHVRLGDSDRTDICCGANIGKSGANKGIPHLNFRLLRDAGGSLGKSMTRKQLKQLIWREVAESQLGFTASKL